MIRVQQRRALHFTKHAVPRAVRAVVLHIAEGSSAAVDSWFASPASKVSAHFLVGRDGSLRQYVSVHDVAWHAGRVQEPTWAPAIEGARPNLITVGIEHEGSGVAPWTEAQLLTSSILSAWLCRRFGLTPTADDFPMHREIFSGKTCPGPWFDRDAYLARVAAVLAVFGDAIPKLITGLR